jgi:hypothetical protein
MRSEPTDAAENRRAGFVNHCMDEHVSPEPRVKRVQDLR